jgi:putative addiction module antidote
MIRLKVTKVGDSLGVALPADVLASLKVVEGDTLYLTETPTGYAVSSPDPALQEQLRVGREIMKKHRDVFHALAKS